MARLNSTFSSTNLVRLLMLNAPKIDKTTQDAIWEKSSYLNEAEAAGGIVKDATTDDITWPVEKSKNSTVGARPWASSINLEMQDPFRLANEDFAEYTGAVVLDELTINKNSSKDAIIKYSMAHINNLRNTFIDKVNTHLLKGSGTYPACTGLTTLIPETVSSGTLHGISRTSNTWWRNQATASSCSTTDAFGTIVLKEAQELAALASGGQGRNPFTHGVVDDATFANAMYYLPQMGTVQNVITGNGGGDTVTWPKNVKTVEPSLWIRGAKLIWDHAATADSMRMFNFDKIKIRFVKNSYFHMTPKQQAEDSFSVRVLMGCAFQHLNMNPKESAVIYNFNS